MAPWGLLVACLPKKWNMFSRFSEFGIPILEENRDKVLRFAIALNVVGFVMAFLGALGGFADGGVLLHTFYWARMKGSKGMVVYAGVKHTCHAMEGESRLGTCMDMVDVDCDKVADLSAECSVCKEQALIMVGPMVIACITYLTLGRNTILRYQGKDSRQAKIMGAFAAFFGGFNFLMIVLGYWRTCIAFARDYNDVEASMGLGLILMGVGAAAFKFIVGFVHVGLPVQEYDLLSGGSGSDDEEESEMEGEGSSEGSEYAG